MVKFDWESFAKEYVTKDKLNSYSADVDEILKNMDKQEHMLDWYDISTTITKSEIKKVKDIATRIRKDCKVFIVIGIGGSFLGAKAVIDALNPYFDKDRPEVIFAGTSLSAEYLSALIKHIDGKSVYVNVISKSGTTMEPSIVFDAILDYMKKTYQRDFVNRIIATTDSDHGMLRELSIKYSLDTLSVPTNIGGRYSVLTCVGLLPIAVAGYDIDELLKGAKNGAKYKSIACNYAVCRHIFEQAKLNVEALTVYEPKLESFTLWAQQLLGETQGKDGKGILPFNNVYTMNLHSIGQYIQDGTNNLFETVLFVKDKMDMELVGKNYMFNTLGDIVVTQVASAHAQGHTPTLMIEIAKLDEYNLGELIYFYFVSAAVGGYLLGVDPFDQPGVELYKSEINKKIKF